LSGHRRDKPLISLNSRRLRHNGAAAGLAGNQMPTTGIDRRRIVRASSIARAPPCDGIVYLAGRRSIIDDLGDRVGEHDRRQEIGKVSI
jgi:hypothetical protein